MVQTLENDPSKYDKYQNLISNFIDWNDLIYNNQNENKNEN